jgi:hypothetical protein
MTGAKLIGFITTYGNVVDISSINDRAGWVRLIGLQPHDLSKKFREQAEPHGQRWIDEHSTGNRIGVCLTKEEDEIGVILYRLGTPALAFSVTQLLYGFH